MIKNKDQVLVLDRNDPVWPGLTFPGGHVEAHESFHDSVVREVKEETGLTISHPQLVGVKQFYDHNDERYLVFFYIAEQFSGTVKESDEGKLTWMSAKELKKPGGRARCRCCCCWRRPGTAEPTPSRIRHPPAR